METKRQLELRLITKAKEELYNWLKRPLGEETVTKEDLGALDKQEVITEYHTLCTLNPHHLLTVLDPKGCLHDVTIDTYCFLLQQREDSFGIMKRKPYLFYGSTCYQRNLEIPNNFNKNYLKSLFEYQHINLKTYSKLFLPYNPTTGHWVLYVVDTENKKITLYDSLRTPRGGYTYCLQEIQHGLSDISQEWEYYENYPEYGNVPQQDNAYDCGVFTCMNANYLGLDLVMDYTKDDIEYFRGRIVSEIMRADIAMPL
jgi:Ulp1 family protease